MHDLGAQFPKKRVQLVDVGTLARTEAQVVQANPALIESLSAMLRTAPTDSQRGAPANVIEEVLALEHARHAQELEQLAVKRRGSLEVGDGQRDVCDAIDLHCA
jgi:hypothetical protein